MDRASYKSMYQMYVTCMYIPTHIKSVERKQNTEKSIKEETPIA